MAVELWDVETRNLIDDFATEAEALRELRAIIQRAGADAIRTWALDRYAGTPLVRGKDLVTLALRGVAA